MSERFEVWAQSEIRRHSTEAERHRIEAEQLERVLKQFKAAAQSAAASTPALQLVPANEPRPARVRHRTSKNDVLLQAFAEAGESGLDMDQLESLATSAGINSDRHALRAYCWHQKQAGRLISLAPGRHAIARSNEAADPSLIHPGDRSAAATHDAVERGEVEHEKMTG